VLILRLPRHQWSLPLVGEKTTGAVEELSCPSLSCSALGVEHERIDEEWNDLSRFVLPSRIPPYPLYIKIGRVHGGLGG